MGAAKIVPRFVAGVKESGQAEVTGIAARNKKKTQKAALELEIPQVYDDYASLVNAAEIDLIYIPLINKQHYPQAKMALEAGKNVLLEKPFTLTLEESQELFKIANEKNLCNSSCNLFIDRCLSDSFVRRRDSHCFRKYRR